jgi:hypothetical protein
MAFCDKVILNSYQARNPARVEVALFVPCQTAYSVLVGATGLILRHGRTCH